MILKENIKTTPENQIYMSAEVPLTPNSKVVIGTITRLID